jgi:hypothetical protein
LLASSSYRSDVEARARAVDAAAYSVPQQLLAAVGDSPVTVDPWEVTAAWTYRLRWHPAPVFQTYSAYTPELDGREAAFLAAAPAGQYVLREAGPGGPGSELPAIDGRNPDWESPRYQLALVCDYRTAKAGGRWALLRKDANRCAPSTPLGSTAVTASRPVTVPSAPPGSVVVAHFEPRAGVFDELLTVLFRPVHPLHASCDGRSYRLPEGEAGGPLIVGMPASARTAGMPITACRSLSFSASGSVRFAAVPISG